MTIEEYKNELTNLKNSVDSNYKEWARNIYDYPPVKNITAINEVLDFGESGNVVVNGYGKVIVDDIADYRRAVDRYISNYPEKDEPYCCNDLKAITKGFYLPLLNDIDNTKIWLNGKSYIYIRTSLRINERIDILFRASAIHLVETYTYLCNDINNEIKNCQEANESTLNEFRTRANNVRNVAEEKFREKFPTLMENRSIQELTEYILTNYPENFTDAFDLWTQVNEIEDDMIKHHYSIHNTEHELLERHLDTLVWGAKYYLDYENKVDFNISEDIKTDDITELYYIDDNGNEQIVKYVCNGESFSSQHNIVGDCCFITLPQLEDNYVIHIGETTITIPHPKWKNIETNELFNPGERVFVNGKYKSQLQNGESYISATFELVDATN